MAWLEPVTLVGEHATLEPLAPAHEPELAEACADGRLWELWYTTVARPEAMAAEIARRLALQSGPARCCRFRCATTPAGGSSA